jgi:hypothetical protein
VLQAGSVSGWISLNAAKCDRLNMASLFYQSKQTTRLDNRTDRNHLNHLPHSSSMVQYDPFVGMFPATPLPTRGRGTAQASTNTNTEHSPGQSMFSAPLLLRPITLANIGKKTKSSTTDSDDYHRAVATILGVVPNATCGYHPKNICPP